jgi:hypothetical protein
LSFGGSVYDPAGGSDSFSEEVLMVEATDYRDAKETAIVEWLMGFKERAVDADIRVDLDETCDVDWSAEPDESAWQRGGETVRRARIGRLASVIYFCVRRSDEIIGKARVKGL